MVQEGCKKSTRNDLVHLTNLRIPLINPPNVSETIALMWCNYHPSLFKTNVLYIRKVENVIIYHSAYFLTFFQIKYITIPMYPKCSFVFNNKILYQTLKKCSSNLYDIQHFQKKNIWVSKRNGRNWFLGSADLSEEKENANWLPLYCRYLYVLWFYVLYNKEM